MRSSLILSSVLAVLCACATAGDPPVPMRLLIKAPPGTAHDSEEWLRKLGAAAGAPVRHVVSMSPVWAAYLVECGPTASPCDAALQGLQASGLSDAVERDERRSAH